jgi:hypothetical protein
MSDNYYVDHFAVKDVDALKKLADEYLDQWKNSDWVTGDGSNYFNDTSRWDVNAADFPCVCRVCKHVVKSACFKKDHFNGCWAFNKEEVLAQEHSLKGGEKDPNKVFLKYKEPYLAQKTVNVV